MKKIFSRIQPVSQEHTMGCAVACVASLCSMKYQRALKLFRKKENAWTRGYYCEEIVQALEKAGLNYTFDKFNFEKHKKHLREAGTIVFVSPCAEYPCGHFLLRAESGWMNPWSNYPLIASVKAAFQKKLPGTISYLLFPRDISAE